MLIYGYSRALIDRPGWLIVTMEENSGDNMVLIVDFCCPSEKLVIEHDGDQHGDCEQIEKDKKRDKYLEGLGQINHPGRR
jgi:hypothetical protein